MRASRRTPPINERQFPEHYPRNENGGRLRMAFALARSALPGMNAHINHDLALALLQTDNELQLTPGHL